jgi:TorA-specific chaperone
MIIKNLKDEKSVLKGYNMLLYFAGSLIMYEPDDECVVDFWSKGILKRLPVSSSNPRFIEAASQLRNSCKDLSVCRENLQNDFKRLFSTPALALAPPVKSFYVDKQLTDQSNDEPVTDFYNSYGWKKRTRYNITDDNLGIELLFLTLLVDKYISFEDEACRSEMRDEIKRFIRQHVLSWLPQWNLRMQKYANTEGYRGIANLIHASCEDIYEVMDKKIQYGNQSEELKN